MYSGFYQHEIRTNLYGAEKLFEAMGYKVMPNQTLVLEGAICPDQVTNVSRDAIIACEECHVSMANCILLKTNHNIGILYGVYHVEK